MKRGSDIVLGVLAVAALCSTARADDDLRDRSIGHVIAAPTAWMPDGLTSSLGIDQKGHLNFGATLGVGLASVELTGDSDVRRCDDCGEDKPQTVWLKRATFRIGVREDRWFRGQPALAFGVRTTFGTEGNVRVADSFVVASRDLGPVRLHAGASIGDAVDDWKEEHGKTLATEVKAIRPLGGIEWTPGLYPKTSLMGDIVWLPELGTAPAYEYAGGIAVRYQAFGWASVELGMRYRQAEEIGDSTFFVRLNATTR